MAKLLNCGPSEAGWSRIAPYTLCERLFWLTRTRRAVEEGAKITSEAKAKIKKLPILKLTSGPLARGSVGHVGMAHLLMRKKLADEGQDPDQYLTPGAAMSQYATEHNIDEEAYLPPMMALEGWDQKSLEHAKIIAVEQQDKAIVGRYDDGTPMKLTTRWDALLSFLGSPLVYSFDHKFMSRHSDATVRSRYTLSGQFLFQNLLGRSKFKDRWGGVVIHAIEAKPPYEITAYQLDAAPAALRDFRLMVRTVLQEIRNKDKIGFSAFTPSFNEQTCSTAYQSRCDFFDFCQWGSDDGAA